MAKKQRRPQAPKVQRVQELRRSNATTPVPSAKAYRRPKAGARERDW